VEETVVLAYLMVREGRNGNSFWDEGEGSGLPRRIPRLRPWNSRGKLGGVPLREKRWENTMGERRNVWKEEGIWREFSGEYRDALLK